MYIPYKLQLLKWQLFRRSEGERKLRQAYKDLHGKELNTQSPMTFSERLFSRMVFLNRHGNPRFTQLADKYLAREYVREKAGEKYLIELLWSGTDPHKLPFGTLPQKCVVKTNHGSGGNIILDETSNQSEVVQRLEKWLKENYYWTFGEYHYYHIPRKILVEKFLEDEKIDGPLDYRFFCFHGKPAVIQVDNHAHDINPFYDTNWKKIDLSYRRKFVDCDIDIPDNFQEMLEVATILSSEFDFVRVDLYNIQGKIYFGELTFTPGGGRFVFKPESWDLYLGQKWGSIDLCPPLQKSAI